MVMIAVRAFIAGMIFSVLSVAYEVHKEIEGITYSYENRTHHFTLSGSFGGFTWPYRNLVRTLNNARAGDKVVIVITHHNGGRNSTREYISDAIARSKAHVTIHVTRWAASNAALLYRHGNVAVIHKKAAFLYHQSFRTDNFGNKSYPKYLYYWSVREHRKVGAFVFMTRWEKRQWEKRNDVVIPGSRICESKFVLTNRKESCTIRGIK